MDSKPNNNNSSQLSPPKVSGYRMNHLIGKGSYGHVYRAEKLDSKEVVAIKCVPLRSLSKNSRENVLNEISILKKLKHDFIVQMLDFQWDRAFVYMIFEYCAGGELASIIRLKKTFPEKIVIHFLQQLASAMKYLRENNVVHLDLKPQNILITGIQFVTLLNGLQTFNIWRHVILKIADFGFAYYLSDDESMDSLRGTVLYMAPEILKRQQYDASADLWSIGIILYECLFGRTPFHGMSSQEIIGAFVSNQVKINLPKNKLSHLCYDLLKGLLKIDPKMRISFNNFFAHPFIDLEHMPTVESFKKAKDILKIANDFEAQGAIKSAFYNFREALLYLMPLYEWGLPSQSFSQKKVNELKSMIVTNIEKAEELQQKCGLINIKPESLEEVQNIYNMIDRARDLAAKDLYSQSLDKYQQAFESAFKMIKESCDPKIKTEFFNELSDWMTEAESVKSKQSQPIEIKEKVIVAEEATKVFAVDPKPDWYLKLKEPQKSNLNAHSKLKHFDNSPLKPSANNLDYSDNQIEEPLCIMQ